MLEGDEQMTLQEAAEWIGCTEEYFLRGCIAWRVKRWAKDDPQMLIWRGMWNDWLGVRVKAAEKRKAA